MASQKLHRNLQFALLVMDIVHICKSSELSRHSCATERTCFDSRQGEEIFLFPKIVHSGPRDHTASYSVAILGPYWVLSSRDVRPVICLIISAIYEVKN